MKISSIILFLLCLKLINSQRIAERKCLEYSQIVYQEDRFLSMPRMKHPSKVSHCSLYDNPLIIGGTAAKITEFPHMVLIGIETGTDLEWVCGGTLISGQHVLTAAHCVISRKGAPSTAKLGMIQIKDTNSYVQERQIESFVIHPEYKKPTKYNDIAILFLNSPVTFSQFVRPACLNFIPNINVNVAIASGFGKTRHGQSEMSETLLKVRLNIIPRDICDKKISYRKQEMPNGIVDSMLCAGDLDGGKDTCQGDSGGPLQIVLEEPHCMYNIIGVTSFGRYCGMKNSPGIYTNVSYFVSWIETTIWCE